MDALSSNTTRPLYRGTQVVWYIVGLLEVLLAFRLVLKFLGANTDAWFTNLIFTLSNPLVAPFVAVFQVSEVQGSTVEWTTVLAMVVYWVVARGISALLVMGRAVSTSEAAAKLDEQAK
jgi:hypothetical protein